VSTNPPGWEPNGSWVGKHRAPASAARKILYRLVVPLIAVGAVVAVILVLIGLGGHSSGNSPGPGVVSATTPRIVIPSITPTHSASSTPSTSPTPTPTKTATHTAAPPQHHQHTSPTAMAAVRVYNTTAIQGLAHHVAAEIEARGWQITAVGNLTGALTESTLFYSPGDHAAAKHLAAEFSGIRRLEANSVAGFTSSGLTLVLTANWHD
jgi:hypothetical protein